MKEIRVDIRPVEECGKGVYCSIPVDAAAFDSAKDPEGRSDPAGKLRRADKVYLWGSED